VIMRSFASQKIRLAVSEAERLTAKRADVRVLLRVFWRHAWSMGGDGNSAFFDLTRVLVFRIRGQLNKERRDLLMIQYILLL
jgi:hypothetical protein